MATPYVTVALPTASSTQDEARRRAIAGTATLVVAGRQTAGRGRRGRAWQEAPRAMYGSLAFRPVWPVEAWPRLSLVAGIAMRQALVDATGGAFALKWPNDILLDGRKCAGILSESEGDLVVVGCGVNLWWPGAPDGVGVVYGTDPGPDLAPVLAGNWAGALLEGLDGGPDAWRRDEYRRFCTTLGADITWEPAGAGKALDIAMDGGLVVDTPGGPVTLSSGEVRTVRRATVARDTQFTDDNDGGRPQ